MLDERSLKPTDLRDMTIGQLQVIVNDLHSQIESLNEELVQLLLIRDELHTEQDAMLVDIEDLTRHAESQQKHMAEKMPAKWKEAIQPENKLEFILLLWLQNAVAKGGAETNKYQC